MKTAFGSISAPIFLPIDCSAISALHQSWCALHNIKKIPKNVPRACRGSLYANKQKQNFFFSTQVVHSKCKTFVVDEEIFVYHSCSQLWGKSLATHKEWMAFLELINRINQQRTSGNSFVRSISARELLRQKRFLEKIFIHSHKHRPRQPSSEPRLSSSSARTRRRRREVKHQKKCFNNLRLILFLRYF